MSDEIQKTWTRVTTQLAKAGARVEALTEGRDPVERAEGYRFLTRVLSAMIDFIIEADGERPAFVRVMTPTRKFYGDCPDTMYHRATLSQGMGYRITGTRGGCIYLAFCVYGLRGKRHAILANVSDAELVFAEDGSFEIILSAERPDGAANWLQLEPAAATLVTRQYFADWETETPARFNIEADGLASLFATPDNQCVVGWYQLAEDEALVMSGRAPTCRYWGVQLWSRGWRVVSFCTGRIA